MDNYRTVYEGKSAEIIEKKSRFIAHVKHVDTEEEALAFIEEIKKKYWDARHNCFAYTVGDNREYTRASDDGEPQGTAGRPILDVILGAELYYTAVVITRYFGGVLLGTGGLVRAYSEAASAGLKESVVIEKISGAIIKVETDYSGIGKIQYIAGERKLPIIESEYTDKVVLKILVPKEREEELRKAITEGSSGRAVIEKEKELRYAMINGNAELFDEIKQ